LLVNFALLQNAMDIDNILNTKGSAAAAAAAAADAQLRLQLEQAAQMNARTNSDMGSDRSSGSSHKQPFHQMSNYSTNISYPSSAQQHGSQMISNGFLPGDAHDERYAQSGDSNSGRPTNDGVPKAFACSTCAKGFARRSDLARHGKISYLDAFSFILMTGRTNPQRCQTSYVRLAELWETIHSEICINRTRSCAHWREASYV
jgi:hypothetical protein